MCGIAGVVDSGRRGAPSRSELVAMAAALQHRGPDESGIYVDDVAGLAHTRLSIIDLATGQQPLANEDRSLWVVFNGEVFNYLELRTELERAGHRFRTRSDTEVIVHAYEEWGDEAFNRFNGQWALAIWDRLRQRLVLSRDRLGVRPLYLCLHRERLYFASEVKALFAANHDIPRIIDPVGLQQTFTFWSVVPPQTMFCGIEELKPGTVRTYERGRYTEQTYWTPRYPEGPDDERAFRGSLDAAVAAVRDGLERATALRMLRADVPVGSYLSGGLDSSYVAALGRRLAGERFHTFSLRFDDAEYDEGSYQQLMARTLGSDHREFHVTRAMLAEALPDVVRHTERPLLRTAPAPLFLLSKLVRDSGIKVVLTGEGADEMFAGYDLFKEGKVRRFWARYPQSRLRPRLLERLYPYLSRSPVAQRAMAQRFFGRELHRHAEPGFAHATRWHGASALTRLFSADARAALGDADPIARFLETLPAKFARWSPLAQDQYIESRTLLSGYLLASQGDRMLMAHSVEGRFPFLDAEVIALADSLPARYKLRALDEKHVLKRAAADLVPAEIVKRPKQPYRAPDALCFVGADAPEYVADVLSDSSVRASGLFDSRGVAALLRKLTGRADAASYSNADNMALIGVLTTQLLHREFVRERPSSHGNVTLGTDIDRRTVVSS